MNAIRLAITLFGAIFSFGCAPTIAESPQRAAVTPLACAGTAFTGRLLILDPNASGFQPTAEMIADIGDAYCNASPTFKRQLDNIDFVFLDATGCSGADLSSCSPLTSRTAQDVSWGERTKGGYSNVGIPVRLWEPSQHAKTYVNLESGILNSLMSVTSNLQFTPAGGAENSSWMTVLAVLAHEVGHIRWYQANVSSGYGFKHDFSRLKGCSFFRGWSSQSAASLSPPRWRFAGDTQNEHKNAPTLAQFQSAPSDLDRNKLLNDLFALGQPWASLWGARSPDEDFVETFKLEVLVNSGLASMPLPIRLPDGTTATPNIPVDYIARTKPDLNAKGDCIRRWT